MLPVDMTITFNEIKTAGLEVTGLEWVRGQTNEILVAGLLMLDIDIADIEKVRSRPTGRSIDSTVDMVDGRRFKVTGLVVKNLLD